ncbi:MAG TPA: heme lyase CcmF/NrfE family subunit [Burkholderiales bacterium]|jgi:cytochrome c-type biogenesis protein CcmF|nr:heme lyase CcmF/NrfE family subunit [Burkholderiales bacterium]
MIPELGHFALILALALALVQAVLPILGAARGIPAFVAVARPVAQGQFVFVAAAFAALAWSFYSNDFTVLNVVNNSNSSLPVQYRIAATWGSHEGSLLLWVLMLSVWMVAVSVFSKSLPDDMVARILGVMGLISVGFLAFLLFTSNPFERLLPAAPDGRDLNPLLQDPGMVIHPPMLYMGYVGFSVAFAFAIAALLDGRLDATWARWSRPWTTAAWIFLTLGIMLGSGWAYYELGWGGWWFWDPVENASFMPWLAGTALIHSLAVTEKRGAFKAWTVLLAILAFSLSLLGTFLVRSGVLTSVHAFATDPRRGVFILCFLALVIGGSLSLYAWRGKKVAPGARFELFSRESMLLANSMLLLVACAAVMLGTLYPLFLDALTGQKISVGPPYFELVFPILLAPAILLASLGPLVAWRKGNGAELARRMRLPAMLVLVFSLFVPLFFGRWALLTTLGLFLAFWIFAGTISALLLRLKAGTKINSAFAGMLLAHAGIGVFILGVTLVKSYEAETDVRLAPGESAELGGYLFKFEGANDVAGPNYQAARGVFVVTKDGQPVARMQPEKRIYRVQKNAMTEAAINSGVTRDLYVSLGEPAGNGAWTARLQVKPFVDWIWGGCLLMALGGLLAAADRRYRAGVRRREVPEAAEETVIHREPA